MVMKFTNLDKLRDEAAIRYVNGFVVRPFKSGDYMPSWLVERMSDFRDGWNACLKALTEAAPEFDEEAAMTMLGAWLISFNDFELDDVPVKHLRNFGIKCAHWQYSNMAAMLAAKDAEIEALKAKVNQAVYEMDKAKADRDKYLNDAQTKLAKRDKQLAVAEELLRYPIVDKIADMGVPVGGTGFGLKQAEKRAADIYNFFFDAHEALEKIKAMHKGGANEK